MIAAACMVYNRPEYFKEVLPSLVENSEVKWYFFLDGPKSREVKECEAMLKGFDVETSNENLGIAKNKQRAHRLFETYDQVLFFEDDMIVSPYYVRVLLKLQEQFPGDIVGAPDGNGRLAPDGNLQFCKATLAHLWGYSMRREVFDAIREKYDAYVEDTGEDYRKRPHLFLKEKYNLRVSSHDGAIARFTKENGVRRINTLVPRGKYIGAEGVHFKPKKFAEKGYPNPNEIVFESDETPEDFLLI